MRGAVRWDLAATTIGALVLCSSLLQAMADRGAGSRYAVTVQALVIVLLVVLLSRIGSGSRRHGPAGSAPAAQPIAGA